MSRVFARRPGKNGPKRVVAALSGGPGDAAVSSFVAHLLVDQAVSVALVSSDAVSRSGSEARAAELLAKHPGRVVQRSVPGAPEQVLLSAARDSDLLVLGLDAAWGLARDGVEPRALRLFGESAASLLLLHTPQS